ncbi:hypothetical protein GCM10009639_39980 [Kitasatospora putterlickiae]|uniref:Uncharacterized protein n=1 Tax=Kitasatospora putterlickiae TaxID=221725 RepID=A0ABN1Y7A1_9ACTN
MRDPPGELGDPGQLPLAEREVQRLAEVPLQHLRVEGLPAGRLLGHLAGLDQREVPGLQEGPVHGRGQPGAPLGEVAADGPDGEDERQPGPLLPHLAQVVHGEALLGRLPQVGAQRRVADQHGRVGLGEHRVQVGRAAEVLRPHPFALLQQQPGEPDGGAAGGAERDPPAVQLGQRQFADDHAGHHRAVAAHGDVREHQQFVRVPQVLHTGDRADVQGSADQLIAQLLRRVLGEVQIEQIAGPGQSPVEGYAVEELNMPDPGPDRGVLLGLPRFRFRYCHCAAPLLFVRLPAGYARRSASPAPPFREAPRHAAPSVTTALRHALSSPQVTPGRHSSRMLALPSVAV